MYQNKLLAAALHDREVYEEMRQLGAFKDFSDKQEIILKLLTEYYNNDPSSASSDPDLIKAEIERKFPKHSEMLCQMVDQLKPVSIPNVMRAVVENRKQSVQEELAAALLVPDNDEKVAVLMSELESLRQGSIDKEEAPKVSVGINIAEVLKKTTKDARIALYPEAIQEATGGALRGHHILIFARPDCGKTTLAINLIYGFLRQGLRVLYMGNEDPEDEVKRHIVTRLTNRSPEHIEADPEGTQELLEKRNINNLIYVTLTPGTPMEVEREVIAHEPDVLIVDQSRNIHIPKIDNKVLALEKVEQFIRNLGKKHDMLTISFTQGGDSAEGKLALTMGDVDFSNTGMQASADLMIGMGVNEDYERAGKRMLSFPKNKLSGYKGHKDVFFDGKRKKIWQGGRGG